MPAHKAGIFVYPRILCLSAIALARRGSGRGGSSEGQFSTFTFYFLLPTYIAPRTFMKSDLILQRLLEFGGLILIGDGLMGLLRPRRHSLLWHFGPELAKAVTEELAEHPKTSRAIYAAELAAGIALATIQLSDSPSD
jgi:hypothetical protein